MQSLIFLVVLYSCNMTGHYYLGWECKGKSFISTRTHKECYLKRMDMYRHSDDVATFCVEMTDGMGLRVRQNNLPFYIKGWY